MAKKGTGAFAEDYVARYFAKHRKINLIRVPKGDVGYDFKNSDASLFIEVKGSTATKLSEVLFRFFSDSEYQMAKTCRRKKHQYEIHLIIGIPANIAHYKIPGSKLLESGKPEIRWYLPTTKDFHQYKLDEAVLEMIAGEGEPSLSK